MKEIKEIIEKATLINKLKQSEVELFKYINSYPDTVDLVFDKYITKWLDVNLPQYLEKYFKNKDL